jgi:tRNA-dihydrouridine synthase
MVSKASTVSRLKPLPEPVAKRFPAVWTALAPMQDVTTLPFMRLLGKYGPPDLLFTEYFRVHGHSTLERHIVDSIKLNGTGRPIFAQLIGESLTDLKRTVEAIEASELPVAGIDLNMGCPAPKVYKKNVGGGLLRDPEAVDRVLGCLRENISGRFTVKMRIGFEDDRNFERLLELLIKHEVDLLSLHARTVKEAYRSAVHYEYIKRAAEALTCPVLANGNVTSVKKGISVLKETNAAGLMIGRSCIRNPWIFRQFQENFLGKEVFAPTLADVRGYIDDLFDATLESGRAERFHINHLKKFLNFIGLGVDPEGKFLHEVRRATSKAEMDTICDRHLIDNGRDKKLFADEPLRGLVARPNCETAQGCSL